MTTVNAIPPREAYSIEEAAKLLGVSHRTVGGLINCGELRAKRLGRHLRISVRELQRLMR